MEEGLTTTNIVGVYMVYMYDFGTTDFPVHVHENTLIHGVHFGRRKSMLLEIQNCLIKMNIYLGFLTRPN